MRPDAATNGAGMASLLLADSRLPVGGYTASGGLEPALLGGLPVHEVPAFIAMRLATVARVEAGTAVVASAAVRHLRAGAPGCTCTQMTDGGGRDDGRPGFDPRHRREAHRDEGRHLVHRQPPEQRRFETT